MLSQEIKNIIYQRLGITGSNERIERLSDEQGNFIIHDVNTPCYLKACPGSGKTEVVGLKAAYELANWKQKFSGLAVLSFTNNAADEIHDRVNQFAGSNATKHPHFIGTVDSWIYNYLFLPFFYRYVNFNGVNGDKSPRGIIDETSEADFLMGFPTYIPYISDNNPSKRLPIRVNKYYFDYFENEIFYYLTPNAIIRLSEYRNNLNLRSYLISNAKLNWLLNENNIINNFVNAKKKFWGSGFFTFRDIDYLSLKILLKKPSIANIIAKRFPIILIDECQDLSPTHTLIFQELLKIGCKIHFIGDLNQSIYEFRNVKPYVIQEFIINNSLITTPLTDNFRSNQRIVNVFTKLIEGETQIIGKEPETNGSNVIYWEYEDNHLVDLPEKFCSLIRELDNEKIKIENSAVLVRGKSLLNKLRPIDNNFDNLFDCLAYSLEIWNKPNKTPTDIVTALTLLGRFISKIAYKSKGSKRTQYAPEGISSYKWRNFLSHLLSELSLILYPFVDARNNQLNMSKWALLVKNKYELIFSKLIIPSENSIDDIRGKRIRDNTANELVRDLFPSTNQISKIYITTVHDVKGKTFDAVLLISSKDGHSPGGHYSHWINPRPQTSEEQEYKRIGYVACSRPKHLLIWAVPTLTIGERRRIEHFGFQTLGQQLLFKNL